MNGYAMLVGGERGRICTEALVRAGRSPSLVVTGGDEGREASYYRSLGVPCRAAVPHSTEWQELVDAGGVRLLVCAGYSRLISQTILSSVPMGGINCHAGRLPDYRGAAVIPWQIINGETRGACYVLRMTPGIDDGPILAEYSYDIGPAETARHVTERVNAIFGTLLPPVVADLLDGRAVREASQPAGVPVRYTKRYERDGHIDWREDSERIIRLVRALDSPYPGAHFYSGDVKVVVRRARALGHRVRGVPGRIVGHDGESLVVTTLDGAVALSGLEVEAVPVSPLDPRWRYGTDLT